MRGATDRLQLDASAQHFSCSWPNVSGSFTVSVLGLKILLELFSPPDQTEVAAFWVFGVAKFPSITAFPAITVHPTLILLKVAHLKLNAAAVQWAIKSSVSSRGAYLDYHCLLAQWMEVSISVTAAGFTEQTRNSLKALCGFHCTKGHPIFLTCTVWLDFEKRHFRGFLISSSVVQWLKTRPLVFNETVDNPSCRVCLHLDVQTSADRVLCWKTLKSLWNVFRCCNWCEDNECFYKKDMNVERDGMCWVLYEKLETNKIFDEHISSVGIVFLVTFDVVQKSFVSDQSLQISFSQSGDVAFSVLWSWGP